MPAFGTSTGRKLYSNASLFAAENQNRCTESKLANVSLFTEAPHRTASVSLLHAQPGKNLSLVQPPSIIISSVRLRRRFLES